MIKYAWAVAKAVNFFVLVTDTTLPSFNNRIVPVTVQYNKVLNARKAIDEVDKFRKALEPHALQSERSESRGIPLNKQIKSI